MTIKTELHQVTVIFSESVAKLQEIVIWLCLTFRLPIPGTVSLSTGELDGQKFTLNSLDLLGPSKGTDCWYKIFESALVALEPSTQPSRDCWLDVNFYIMIQIAAVEYPVYTGEGLVLMGPSTALVPIRITDDGKVVWHFETTTHDSLLKTSELTATKGPWLAVRSLEELQSERALLD